MERGSTSVSESPTVLSLAKKLVSYREVLTSDQVKTRDQQITNIFKLLLDPNAPRVQEATATIFGIRRALEETIGTHIPDILVDNLQMQKLLWKVYQFPGDSEFFGAGFLTNEDSCDLGNALSTLQVSATGPSKSGRTIRIASLHLDSYHSPGIVALEYASYNHGHSINLERLQVSLNPRSSHLFNRTPMLTNPEERWVQAGFITREMVKKATLGAFFPPDPGDENHLATFTPDYSKMNKERWGIKMTADVKDYKYKQTGRRFGTAMNFEITIPEGIMYGKIRLRVPIAL